jgi:TolB-like protein
VMRAQVTPQEPPAVEVERQLERIVASEEFANAAVMQSLLRYLAQETLSRKAGLNAGVVQLEFELPRKGPAREPRHEPHGSKPADESDPNAGVRSNVARLRKALKAYYSAFGALDPILIEIPPGGYRVTFRYQPGMHRPVKTTPHVPVLPTRLRPVPTILLGALALLAPHFRFILPPRDSLAVLPFTSKDPGLKLLCDSVTEEVIDRTAALQKLNVTSKDSAYRAVKSSDHRSHTTIGKELHVDKILTGTLERDGTELTIDVELIGVQNDRHLWGHKYRCPLSETTTVDADIAAGVAKVLNMTTGQQAGNVPAND